MSATLRELETPAVVVDRGRLEQNLRRIQAIATANGLRVRPHSKTHKCRRIAELQVEHGVVGLTCAKVSEALYFLAAGIPSVTIAYPLVSPNKVRSALAEAAYLEAELRLTVDSDVGVRVIDQAAAELGVEASVFVKVDVGLHRCGLEPGDPRLADVVVEIDRRPTMRFAGILSHAGHAYAAGSEEEVRRIAEDERRSMVGVRDDLRSRGVAVPEVSVGSTPTVLACQDFTGITEIRPGNYVFMDRTPLRLSLIDADRISLFVVATVVSRNDSYLIVDAGSKVLSSDAGGHGFTGQDGFGLAFPLEEKPDPARALRVQNLSEEHGWIGRQGRELPLGSKVRVLPNHSCVVANLTDELTISDGERVIDVWSVGARGKVR